MLRPDVWQCSIYFIQRKCVNTVQTKKTLGANVSPKLRKTNDRTLMSTIPVQQFLVLVGLMLTRPPQVDLVPARYISFVKRVIIRMILTSAR